MPNITIESLNNVIIDGVPAGKLVDVTLNYRPHLAQISAAVDAWVNALQGELDTIKARTAQAVTAAAALLAETDPDKLRAGMAKIVAFAEAPETARQLAEAEAEATAAQARVEALKKSM